MGEETEGVVESTSKLQEKLKALTGVDILTDSGAYKDTYTILKEIGEVWEDLDPMDQAAALELMAGKNRANTLAAILNNMEDLKGAYADALGAEGSAMRENETFLNSIEGRISLFNNALQTMWMNFIDDGTVKSIVDLGTAFIKLTDNVGVFKMALAGVAVYLTAFKKINPMTMVKDAMSSMQNYTNIVKQIQSINSMVGPAKAMSFEQFNAGPVNAYAAAVSNLTAKQQAATLAASGLNSEQIASVLTKNGLSAANVKLAMSEAGVAQATTQTATVTGLQIAATMKQQGVALSQNATNFLLAHSTEEVTKKMLAKAVVAGQITHQEAVLIMTSMGVVAANTAQAFSWKALGTAISAAFKSNPIGMLISLASAISAIVLPALDALIDSTEDVKQRAEDALAEYSNSQSELKTIKSNLDALSDDYEKLAVGVDEFGNNINLSTSQYERYNEIVNQIADMFPQMVKGYTAEGNAIIKNKGNVEALTAAYESLQSVASNTLLASADDIMENYENTFQAKWYENGPSTDANKIKASRELSKMLNNQDTYNFGAFLYDNKNDGIITTMVNLLKDAGIEKEAWYEGEDEYIKRAIKDFPGIVQSIVNTWESTANAAVSNVKPLISAYLDTSVGYAGLNEEQKQIIDSMVASLDEEFFNAFDGDASKLYMALESMIQNLKTSGFDDEYNLMLNIKTSFNNNDITVEEYQSEINNFKAKLDALVADGLLSETDAKYIKLSIGIDDEGMGNELDSMVAYAQKIVDTESKNKVLTLTYSDLQIINSDEFEVPEGTLLSWEELKQKIAEIRATLPTDVNTIQTYTALSEKASTYNDILTQTNEITANNMEVAQEYKDSLSDLGFTTEELSECFDENNVLVVKNSKRLRELVTEKKKAAAADVKLAKAQSRLEYYDLVNQLNKTLSTTKQLDDVTRASINSTLAQLNVVEQAIYKYQLLEDSLLGTTNAFEEFAQAQEIDALNTYGDSYVEMVQTMYDGIYKTGEVGTEAFWSAVEHLVPEEAYQHLTEDADRMDAIIDYFNKKIAPTLTLEEDQFSFDFDAIENFVEEALEAGVFSGDTEKFNLVEGMNLEEAAELLNMTTAQAYAFFAELDKYNISGNEMSFLSQLDDSTDGQIMKITNSLEDLNKQKLALLEDGGYAEHGEELDAINKQIEDQNAELDKLGEKSAKTWQDYSQVDGAISALNQISDKQKELTAVEAAQFGIEIKEGDKITVENALKQLEEKKAKLEQPTVLTAQLAQEHIQSELGKLQEELGQTKFTAIVKAELEQDENGTWVVKENKNRSDADTKYAQQIAALMNADKDITAFLETGLNTTDTYLSSIDGTLKSILARLGGEPAGGSEGDNASDGGANPAAAGGGVFGGGLRELLDKHGISTTSVDGTSGNENYIVGDKNVTIDTEKVDIEPTGEKDTENQSEQNQGYTGVNNPNMVPYERWKRGEILLPWDENIYPKPSVNEEAVREALGLLGPRATNFNSDDYTLYPGQADPSLGTIPGGSVNAETVEVEATGTTEVKSESGGGGAVGGIPTATMRDDSETTSEPKQQTEKSVVEAEEVTLISDSGQNIPVMGTGQDDVLNFMAKNGLSQFMAPSTRIEPKEPESIEISTDTEELNHIAQQIHDEYQQANVDLLNRPKVAWRDMNAAGWDTPEGSYSTVDTVTFTADDFGLSGEDGQDYAINVTPILPDGTVIEGGEDGLRQYINDKLSQGNQLEDLDIFLGSYGSIAGAVAAAQKLHELQEEYYAIKSQDDLFDGFEKDVVISEDDAIEAEHISKSEVTVSAEVDLSTESAEEELENFQDAADEISIEPLNLTWDDGHGNFYADGNDPLGLNNAYLSVERLMAALDNLGMNYKKIDFNLLKPETWFSGDELQFNILDLVDTLRASGWTPEAIQAYCQQLSESANIEGGIITIEGLEEVDSYLETLDSLQISDKTTDVEVTGAAEAEQELNNVNALAQDETKTITVTTRYQTVGKGTVRTPGSGGRFVESTVVDVNGTAHAQGTAHKGGSWGAPATETALTGELGPELRVRGNRWELLGENGAEFNKVRKGDIIFNHKQTESLLTNGYITGRGKAFAEGTIGGAAYSGLLTPLSPDNSLSNTAGTELGGAADKLSGAAGDVSDAADEFREVFDWIEVRLEEINEKLGLKSAELENAVGSSAKNAVIDDMIDLNKTLYDNLTAGATKYHTYAQKLLAKIPAEYRDAAQNGSIAIEEFVGEVDEKTLNAIQEYREWAQKGADVTQQAEETLTEIANLAKQAIDNIAQDYDNKKSFGDSKIEQFEAFNALTETDLGYESASIYQAMIEENNRNIAILQEQRNAMLAELNKRVESGEIERGSQAWYDAINEIAAVDTEIVNLKTDTENYQDAINDLHWDKFDSLINRLQSVSEEAENLIDILGNDDLVDEAGNWTDEGITSLGLYAQQMEAAEVEARKYQDEIDYLNNNWQELGYTEDEYLERLGELKDGQYAAIKSYHDSKDAIVDMTKARVDAIKEGIEKEIEAYEELINKKKEELDAEKDLYDFQKGIASQQKNIAEIQRKLAALSSDNSASARAKRAQLEAELAEAQQELADTYYDRSVSNQQDALDKELDAFNEEKNKEMEGWDEYLENTNQVVADCLATVQENTATVYQVLQDLGEEYGLSITESLTSPWQEGENAIQSFAEQFGISMSATVEELQKLEVDFIETMANIELAGTDAAKTVRDNFKEYKDAEYIPPAQEEEPTTQETPKEKEIVLPKKGSKVTVKAGTTHWGEKSGSKKMADFVPGRTYTVSNISGAGSNAQILLSKKDQNKNSSTYGKTVYMGWISLKDLEGYASGTTGVKNSQFAWIDELGEELVIRPSNGRMTFMEKGTGVIPADLTSNLMGWGELDPSIMLERNKPVINAPHVTNNNVEINMEFGEVVHIDTVTNDTIPNLTKAIEKQMDKYMKNVNNNIRKYAR